MKRSLPSALIAFGLLAAAACSDLTTNPTAPRLTPLQSVLASVMQVQDRHTPQLLRLSGVVGTAAGLDPAGRPVIFVLTKSGDLTGIPGVLENIPVTVRVTGEFQALTAVQAPSAQGRVRLTRLVRPVPNGVSVGNNFECAAGTLGTGLVIGGQTYALSNNHVFARQNNGAIGEVIVQPGRFDSHPRCADDTPA